MSAKYLIRLDDASEYMDYKKWGPYFELFDRYDVKPIIAVIPFNKDPDMVNEYPDDKFWDKVRFWQEKKYHIAMHGFKHLYTTRKSGVIGLNKTSEFAGIPPEKQEEMLAKGYKIFGDQNIKVDIFVAPGHSFDKNTLRSLRKVTKIRHISDGFYFNPIQKDGFKWIPQQLWQPQVKSKGVWTICYHPETSDSSSLTILEAFLISQAKNIIDPFCLDFINIKFEDRVFSFRMKLRFKLSSFARSIMRRPGEA
jgi:hypothetical protein